MPFCATSLVPQKKTKMQLTTKWLHMEETTRKLSNAHLKVRERKTKATQWFVVIANKKKKFCFFYVKSTHCRFFSCHLKQSKVHPPLDFFLLSFEIIAQSRHGHIGQMVTHSQSVNHSPPNILINKNCICWVQPLQVRKNKGLLSSKKRWTIEKFLFCQYYQFCQ